jgi:hypothetical protein
MIKDMHFYRAFDLADASRRIRQLGDDRGNHEVFGDAIHSLFILAKERVLLGEELKQVLGKPNRVIQNDAGEVWEYDWSGFHGPDNYRSSTPFQVISDVCTGLAADEEQKAS